MNKITNLRSMLQKVLLFGGTLVAILFVSALLTQNVNATITNQMDFGARGSDVTELQTYLATNSTIYPSGLVTGYFGSLTQAATQRFQTAQGIVFSGTPATTGFGRVGPQTIIRVNSLNISNQTPISWDSVPVLSSPSIQINNNSATFTWTTNEATTGQVYYDTAPIRTDESTGPRQQPYVSGISALDSGGLQTIHTVTVQNLQPNTLYYYMIKGVDSVGNMSMTWPSALRTAF